MAQLDERDSCIIEGPFPRVELTRLSPEVCNILFAEPSDLNTGGLVSRHICYQNQTLLIDNSFTLQKSRSAFLNGNYAGSKGSDDSGIGVDDGSECSQDSDESRRKQRWKGADEKGEYEVQKIVDHQLDNFGRDMFRVKWCGWGDQFNTWEPLQHLRCHDALRSYMKKCILELLVTKHKPIPVCKKLLSQAYRDVIEHWVKITPKSLYMKKLEDGFNQKVPPVSSLSEMLSESLQTKSALKSETLQNDVKQFCAIMRLKELRKEQLKKLKDWENMINSLGPGGLTVENNVDLEGPPKEFIYITENRPGAGVDAHVMVGQVAGCECNDVCGSKEMCCPNMAGVDFAYSKGRLIVSPRCGIFECNRYCNCDANCPNRVVQSGRKVKLSIFRTSNGRGWGVKAGESIEKGTFLATYLGEIITGDEATIRDTHYELTGLSYLFDLDMMDDDEAPEYTVDAKNYGNESHFINHSCNPNAHVAGVWIETNDPAIPLLALFAKKRIKRGEELTFNYQGEDFSGLGSAADNSDSNRRGRRAKHCKCGERNCKGYYF